MQESTRFSRFPQLDHKTGELTVNVKSVSHGPFTAKPGTQLQYGGLNEALMAERITVASLRRSLSRTAYSVYTYSATQLLVKRVILGRLLLVMRKDPILRVHRGFRDLKNLGFLPSCPVILSIFFLG